MSTQSISLSGDLYRYLLSVSLREPDILSRLRAETASHEMAQMQISPEQGQFMALLLKLMGAKKTLEVGVFTGYSALVTALALPPDGRVVACDINPEWTAVARRYWTEAGVADRIDLRLAPAAETLGALLESGEAGSFDFAFIDADKENYLLYYERVLALLRPGGLLAVDNTLWSGRVVDKTNRDSSTLAIREFNSAIAADSRIDLSLVPIGDGLTLALKRD